MDVPAKALYHEREIVNKDSFDLPYWKGIRYVMKARFNKSFATFYTKHVIGCCGVQHHLHNIDENVINVCPCCKEPDETTSHILLCKDEDRTTLFKKSVRGLMTWMVKEDTSPQIIKMVGDYLRARNAKTMVEIYKCPQTDDLKGTVGNLHRNMTNWDGKTLLKGEFQNSTSKSKTVGTKGGRIRSVERQSKHGR